MKLILTILTFNALVALGQGDRNGFCNPRVDTLTNLEVFTTVDGMPTVDGGMQALYEEISGRIKYPHPGEFPIDTKLIVAFVVDNNGRVRGKRVVKNIDGTDLGEQLLEIVDDLKWKPGFCNGKAVPTLQVVPMIICLD